MKTPPTSIANRPQLGRANYLRWFGVLAVSLLIHLLLLLWMDGNLPGLNSHTTPTGSLQAKLQPLPKPIASTEPVTEPPPAPKSAVKSAEKADAKAPAKPRRKTVPLAEQIQPEENTASVAETMPTTAVESPAPPVVIASTEAIAPVTDSVPPKKTDELPTYKIKPPPPASLEFTVQTTYSGNPVVGTARFEWQHDNAHYQLRAETEVPLFFVKINLANLESRGNFDEGGVAPTIYQEKVRNRSQTNTHFNHFRPNSPVHPTNDNSISFSSNSKTFPRPAGAQDRISILWQLAGMARAAPESVTPGADFAIAVAGSRDVDIWHIKVIAQEELRVNGKNYQAWHLQRLARPGSYESTLDIWLAPAQEWLPIRILYTENNGETRDLSLSKIDIKPAPPPLPPAAEVTAPISTPAPTANTPNPNPP